VTALRQGLKETSYIEGENVAIEYRWADGQNERVPALVAELVRRPVRVLVAANNVVIQTAKAATSTIPIVFVSGDDPLNLGFVSSLSRPVGNVTGVTFYAGTLIAKQLELLREVVPQASIIGMLVNPTSPATAVQIKEAEMAARTLGWRIHVVTAGNEREFDKAFASFVQQRADALIVGGDALFAGRRKRLVELAARYALPAVYVARAFVDAGGLMSYGSSMTDAYRQAGIYAGRILQGAKPSDLPVQQPTKFEFVLNLKTAKTLGVDVPLFLQQRADEVIE
jgi:putative ABC transport system substrate-binding protein